MTMMDATALKNQLQALIVFADLVNSGRGSRLVGKMLTGSA